MKQVIDGKEVDLTTAEVDERIKREAEWEAGRADREKAKPADVREAAVAALIIERASQPSPPSAVVEAAKLLVKDQ